ncbi:hypothetical protein L1857_00290 [Amycolatopsis thermalba]|uniref:DUF5666 domain-containing protein n=1 Tax=Amycolatopsis thermalba TaxID=944492 RepID=A0ABY4NQQ4_9PSEU|nr:hypothetical protein [Amycolatopsis thermalba]UQS21376.1 hypothetical protein L1857_00290 [Amycolatopsis thermalba]
MSTEPTTTEAPAAAWGDPQPPAPKWSGRKTAIAAAVAVVIAAVGGVAIYAGTSSEANQQGGMGGFPGGGRMGQMGGSASILREALHGDFTVAAGGGYAVERFQTGEVSALSATSITVRSEDDYTQTYVIDSATQKASNLATGSTVTVLAKVSGDTATATSITEGSAQQSGPGGFPGGQAPGGQGPGGGRP